MLIGMLVAFNSSPALAEGSVWDGSVDVTWYNTTDTVFYIDTPAKLAGLAAIVNGLVPPGATIIGNSAYIQANGDESGLTGSTSATYRGMDDFKGKTVQLTADLDMGGVYNSGTGEWSGPNYMPVGGQYMIDTADTNTLLNAPFNGIFDGQGHTVKNIYCNRYTTVGFDWSQSVGLIGRLGVHDQDAVSLRADNPAVRNVVVTGYIYARRSVGGIVGKIGKTNNGGIIENCANFATVRGTDSKGTGGIVGAGWNGGYIKNCYNAGNVINNYNDGNGGISGANEVSIYNCYNIGTITGPASCTYAIGHNNGGIHTISNCYWLTGSAPGGGYSSGGGVTERTAAEMKTAAFLEALNGDGRAFVADTGNINNGYPILRVQVGDSATLTSITKESDPAKLNYVAGQTFDTASLAIWANYSDGTREKITNYTISKTTALETTDTTITVSGVYGGTAYSYDFTIAVQANALAGIAIQTPPANLLYAAGETFNPAGMVVRATYTNGITATLTADAYTLSPDTGTALTPADTKITVSYTYEGVTMTAEQAITVSASPAPGKDADDVYELSTADHMLWFANQVNTGLNNAIKGKLMNDIDLSEVTWTPIGNSSTKKYAGAFDGSGRTVTLTINASSNYTGLFGYVQDVTVKNLTMAGAVSGNQYVAGLVAYAQGVSVIENCVNNAVVTGTSQRVGGIVAYASNTATVTGCTNNGAITGTYNVGGVVGYINNTVTVTGCTNNGAVTGTYNVGGVVGTNQDACTLNRCANTGAVTATSTAASTGYSVGGIVGYAYAATTMDQFSNTGAVNGGVMNVGGVVGYMNNGSAILTNAYNTGSVTSVNTSGTARTGGVVGCTNNAACTVQNTYNAGSITVSNTGAFTAGVIGNAKGNTNVSNNYYLNTTASIGLGYAADNAVSKTSDELKALAPALGQYFKQGSVYPILTWQPDETSTINVTGVSLDKTSDTITVGGTGQLTATVVPADASNQSVTWASDNTAVATVDGSGLVTAVAPGSATITVTTADGGYTATCAVTVSLDSSADSSAPVWPAGSSLNAVVSADGQSVALTWSAATDNTGVTGYRIYRNGTLATPEPVSGTSYSIDGLAADTQYTFRVTAGDAAGNWSVTGPSATVITTTPASDRSAPYWPAGSSVTATGVTATGLTLNWTAAADNVGVTSYRITQNGTQIATVDGATSYNVTGLSAKTGYTFRVTVGDAVGNWSRSSIYVTVTTP
ncbi:Ig-like domain-containing protein [Pelotomaculum terephthalicicum JT]|uniref:Ig-like domain-containing protein n=1 Tax=Pelotomaculum terephthalicicum TaxID=206393 RepID=UPI001F035EEF|nr:Ig-like domain-containing protein [Pelotomaculum terephthalicicum]MCG9967274.1 Ig-like domain-containing protein [Pelotomaculum terephthalicicum JT]